MRCKTIGATFILLLMTQVISAQENSGSAPFRPGVHLKNDAPSRTKEQKEYDKAIDREYRSKLKEIPDSGKRDPWANIRPTPPGAAKSTQ
jgi:Na+-transporting NADH:ubiquinone oxidoreductase subunit NqrF